MTQLLLVEDEKDFAFALTRTLKRHGYETDEFGTGAEAIEAAKKRSYQAAILDLGLPDLSGHEVLKALLADDPDFPVVVLSGRDEASSAVLALRTGAFDYLVKPINSEELTVTLNRACERAALKRRIEAISRDTSHPNDAGIGASPEWLAALDALRAAASSPRTAVLVTGESGTGKERCASLVHAWSERAHGPLITVNAACFAPSLLESELFGHEAGAFTGARGAKKGVFELAHGGTLFLDEIGELPLELQPKLLRVLDGHPFRRLGGERDIRVDVRVVSATNRSLEREVQAGRFRLDLYHRLRVVEVSLPPLRARGEDIELLACHFLEQCGRQLGRRPPLLTTEALEALRSYSWPGNVRELKNVMERASVLCRGSEMDLSTLPREIASRDPGAALVLPESTRDVPNGDNTLVTLEEALNNHVLAAYRACGENVSRTARVLGVSRMTLRKRLRDLGVRGPEGQDEIV